MPWLDATPPTKPNVGFDPKPKAGRFSWQPQGDEKPNLWVIRLLICGDSGTAPAWETRIYPGSRRECETRNDPSVGEDPVRAVVSAVDRFGNESEPTLIDLAGD
jgi:hypothetical protein